MATLQNDQRMCALPPKVQIIIVAPVDELERPDTFWIVHENRTFK
jgi:hypothetical protein